MNNQNLEDIVEGDKVAARFIMRGKHQGVFFGVSPNGKRIQVQAMNFYRLSNEEILKNEVNLISLVF
ncbi:MAG: ester cyclase [Segetibacter sp.]